jgi:ammonia channel protein AmtB
MDFTEMGFVPVAAIVVLCFLVGLTWKRADRLDDKWIPTVCGCVGLILGVVGRTVIDGFPAVDTITAAAIGVVSGLAATGAHQIYKQLSESIEDDLKSAGGEM